MKITGILLAAVLLLTGCGDDQDEPAEPDYAAWEADLAEIVGHPVEDFPTIRDLWEDDICTKDETEFAAFVAIGLDQGNEDILRTSIAYACPERADEIDQVPAGY